MRFEKTFIETGKVSCKSHSELWRHYLPEIAKDERKSVFVHFKSEGGYPVTEIRFVWEERE